jgi:hypothetical protein
MRRRIFVGLLVLMMAAGSFAAATPARALQIEGMNWNLGCSGFSDLDGYWLNYNRDNTGTNAESYSIRITDGNGKTLFREDGTIPLGYFFHGGFASVYQSPPEANPITLRWVSNAGNGLDEQLVYEGTGYCEGLPSGMAGGCDQYVNIPAQAVGGMFNVNATVYYEPSAGAATTTVIPAGNSYLVAGQDASGMYRKVLVSCQWVWVQAGTVGPNPQSPWNGAPLPTTVVN